MAIFELQTPDGRKFQVDAPDMETAAKALDSQPQDTSWSDVGKQALANAPESALNFGKAMVQPFMHPAQTLQTMIDLPSGAIREGAKAVLPEQTFNNYDEYLFGPKDVAERSSRTAQNVGGFYKDRYGSMEGFKRSVATDPVGVLGDAATVLTGGGAAMTKVGPLAKVGQAARIAGAELNPLTQVARVANATGKLGKNVLGMTTGTSADAVGEAYRAGVQGGAQGKAFRDNLRGKEPQEAVLDEAHDAITNISDARGLQYRQDMRAVKANTTPINMVPIVQAFNGVVSDAFHNGHQKYSDATMNKLKDIHKVIDEWYKDPSVQNAGGLDALKQRIDDLMPPVTEKNGQASRVVTIMRNAVKDEIVKQAPQYATAMKNYESSKSVQTELERSLSLGKRASADTTLRKLQSLTRNNANTNYGSRMNSARTLKAAGAQTLMPRLAGQALNTMMPRGLRGPIAAASITGLGAAFNPWMLPAILATSPRLVGEATHLLGRGGNIASRLPVSRGGLLGSRALGNAGLLGSR